MLTHTKKQPHRHSDSLYTPSYSHTQCLLALALPNQRSNTKAPCLSWQESQPCLIPSLAPQDEAHAPVWTRPSCELEHIHRNTHSNPQSHPPSPPSLLDRTKKLMGEVCGKEMGRLAGSSCCHHGYQLTHFSTQPGPPSPAEVVTSSFG